jgi:diamine N-acetyltransferase
MILQGKNIHLRALEPTDLDFLYALENDTSLWQVSDTITPFSKYVLTHYLENSHRDIFDVKQVRLIVEHIDTKQPLGCIDLFDFNPQHNRVGVGLVIFDAAHRAKGYATESLKLICVYAQEHLQVHQIFANISEQNKESISLFEKAGFLKKGVKKDWIYHQGTYKDQFLYQYIVADN